MRIACLQFAPQLGDLDNNLSRADAILERADAKNLDLLVLPELAFSGYNFKSLNHISPYLEFNGKGISSLWARTIALKHDCTVTVGYPECVDITDKWPADPEYYSSAVTYGPDGEQLINYRKAFLYHIDETWALEGREGFFHSDIPELGKVAMGICMDLNPYRFQAPWHAWEFANHILSTESNLVIISMAWLIGVNGQLPSQDKNPKEPDMATLQYWLSRLEPLIRSEMEGEIIVVFANRCGIEDKAMYAGTSAVLGIEAGEVKLYGILGYGENELLVVDTSEEPIAKLVTEPSSIIPEVSSHDLDASSSASTTPAEERFPVSIDAILAASKPISPVEPRFPHAYYAPEPPKDQDIRQIYSSSGHPHEVVSNVDSLAPSGVIQGNRNSVQSSISSSIQSSAPTSIQSVSPSVDYSATTSSPPSTNRLEPRKPDSRKGTPLRADLVNEAATRNRVENSLVIPTASLKLSPASEDYAEPSSASSMTTNTPWDKDPPIVPFEERASARKSSPVVRDASPFIAALQQSTSQSHRIRTPASKSPQPVQPEPEQQKPIATPLGIYKEPESGPSIIVVSETKASPQPSRHPTADPAFTKPALRGLFPPDNLNSALRPHSTGW